MPTELTPRPRLSEARSWLSEHRAAATVVGGLTAASLLLWGALVVGTGDGPTGTDARGQQAGAPSSTSEEAGNDRAGTEPDEGTPEPDTTPEPEPTSDLTPELVAQPEPLDPDDHAPLDAADPGERWIVVLASYTRPSAAERDLRTRTASDDAHLLWSSHYAGLTPDLWVVFTGPFPDRGAALDAADTVGGDAYAREVAPQSG